LAWRKEGFDMDDWERFRRIEKRAGLLACLATFVGVWLAASEGHVFIGVGVILLAGISFAVTVYRATPSLSKGEE
jgi:hypothetical protein